jgi:hypothetical protein
VSGPVGLWHELTDKKAGKFSGRSSATEHTEHAEIDTNGTNPHEGELDRST